ncbi:hypothetical protein O0V02_16990 [Gordonia amicalis]|uniref:hypothetical protein n=1 Tax=Gordonia amicalis TaxID=89053 RepID=UPI0022A6B998|nr:hypothetical protein [Gordonia amicalis]MCZ0914096.1 hypothetical protein [Gordonia amicalis]
MSKNVIKTATVATLAGAALFLGAGLASADTAEPALDDGHYTLDIAAPISLGLPSTVGSVPAEVVAGQLVVSGYVVPATLDAFDEDEDGTADGAAVIVRGSTWGALR